MPKQTYRLTVEPLTCVHIGTGEKLSPLDYKVENLQKIGNMYLSFSSDSILKRIAADKQKFSEFDRISSSGNLRALEEFFHKNFTMDDLNYPCKVTKEFLRKYNENIEKDPLQNAAEVLQMYHPLGKKYPVIPGSSLKGSIRTAVLNDALDTYAMRNELRHLRDPQVQQRLLHDYKDAKQDPFRAIQISDCNFGAKGTQIVGLIKNIKTDRYNEVVEHNTSQIQAEVIKGQLMTDADQADIKGESRLVINSDLASQNLPLAGVTQRITGDKIASSCNKFYFNEFKKEYENFYKEASGSECDAITQLLKILKAIADKNDPKEFILRVGRWSQVEFVTYEHDLREPKTPRKNGRQMPYGTTRWVFNNDGIYLPLGWCKCTITPEEHL